MDSGALKDCCADADTCRVTSNSGACTLPLLLRPAALPFDRHVAQYHVPSTLHALMRAAPSSRRPQRQCNRPRSSIFQWATQMYPTLELEQCFLRLNTNGIDAVCCTRSNAELRGGKENKWLIRWGRIPSAKQKRRPDRNRFGDGDARVSNEAVQRHSSQGEGNTVCVSCDDPCLPASSIVVVVCGGCAAVCTCPQLLSCAPALAGGVRVHGTAESEETQPLSVPFYMHGGQR